MADNFEMLQGNLTIDNLLKAFGESGDIIHRKIKLGGNSDFPADVIFVDGLVAGQWVGEEIMRPLSQSESLISAKNWKEVLSVLNDGSIHNHDTKVCKLINDASKQLLGGCVLIIPDGYQIAYCYEAKGFPQRGITEPSSENVVKGAKDGFIENVRFNTALLRRKIKNPYLRFQETVVGRRTNTLVSIAYIEGITNSELVQNVRKRIDGIDIDGLIYCQQFEEYMIDNKKSLFPQMLYTERSDKLAAYLLEGRVCVLIDGMPIGYAMPATFAEIMRAPDDYSTNFIFSSFISLLRYSSFVLALILPAMYLAIICFHQEMIPATLALSIAESKKNVPYSSVVEVIIMLIAFETLVEAGIRMPKTIGSAVSIVGALVVGQSAVEAHLVTPAVMIVVAFAGIAGFILPSQDFAEAVRFWRLSLVIGAAVAGFFGVGVLSILFIYNMCCIESFGVAYMSPFSFHKIKELLTRTIVRPPLRMLDERPSQLKTKNVRNQK